MDQNTINFLMLAGFLRASHYMETTSVTRPGTGCERYCVLL